MTERNVTVTGTAGLHARPIALLADRVRDYTGTAELIWGEKRMALKDMIGLFSLSVPAGAALTIRVSGPDEESVAEDIAAIIESAAEQ
jgi:Phosphotransferase System HPr (HPr) Family